jgi:ABC-type Fe3+ transport system permease subunit
VSHVVTFVIVLLVLLAAFLGLVAHGVDRDHTVMTRHPERWTPGDIRWAREWSVIAFVLMITVLLVLAFILLAAPL